MSKLPPQEQLASHPPAEKTSRCPRLLVIGHPNQCPVELPNIAELAGYRLLAICPPVGAAARLAQSVGIELIWLIAPQDPNYELAAAITAAASRFEANILCEAEGQVLDHWYGALASHPGTQFLSGATPSERLAAAQANFKPDRRQSLNDSSTEHPASEIATLQQELQRMNRLLEGLSARIDEGLPPPMPVQNGFEPLSAPAKGRAGGLGEPGRSFAPQPPPVQAPPGDLGGDADSPVTAAHVRAVIRRRRLRERFFDAELFADPAWDMLLDLYAAQLEGRNVSVSSLCIAAAVPATTALRWVKAMTDGGWLVRTADPMDGRRIFIALGHDAGQAMADYFAASTDSAAKIT